MTAKTDERWTLDVRPAHSLLPWHRYRWTLLRYLIVTEHGAVDVEIGKFASGYAWTHDRAWNKANTTWERNALKEIKKGLKP